MSKAQLKTAGARAIHQDVYTRITDKIIEDLEKGVRPWMKPWSADHAAGSITKPLRHNGQPYNGINVIMLWSEAFAQGYSAPIWMTFRQAKALGGHVRKGEHGSLVVYADKYLKIGVDDQTGEETAREVPFVKGYTVFNVDQIDDLPARAWSRVSLSSHSVWVGNWDRAEREITEALDIYSQLGDWRRWGVAAWLWPQVAQGRGQLRRARDLWAELYEVANRHRDTRHQVRGRGGQFFTLLTLDEGAAARNCLTAIEEQFAVNPEMMAVEERLWHAARAAWALQEGDGARAAAEARETLAAIGRARFKFDLLDIFATPAEVLLTLRERGEATEADTRAALKALGGFARTYAFGRPRASRAAGRAALLAGDRKKAEKLWKKSLAQADALGMAHERELTLALMSGV